MNRKMTFCLASIGAVSLTAAVSSAEVPADVTAELRALQEQVAELRGAKQEVAALRGEIAELRANQDEAWLNERRAEEVKTLIRDVLSDSDLRASLAGHGLTAGHNGKKFFLANEDGSFLLNLEGQIQIRYVANFRDRGAAAIDEDEFGFQLRRTKLKFSGHIADPKIKYVIQLEIDRGVQTVIGDVIKIGYDLSDDIFVWAGEDKGPFLREEVTSSKRQLAIERSLVNEVFTLDVIQGAGFKWDAADNVKVQGVLSDGARSGDSGGDDRVLEDIDVDGGVGFTDDPAPDKDFHGDAVDFAITGRIDVLFDGDWKQGKDFTSWDGEPFFATVGAAIHYEVDETGDTTDNDRLLMWTVDGSAEFNSFNVYASFVMAHTDFETQTDFDPWGVVVQGGYMIIPDTFEPFIRFEQIDLDNAQDPALNGEDSFELVTIGFNWYHKKHAAKFSADVVWAFDPLPGGLKGLSDSLGLLADEPNEEDQMALRLQYQLLF